MSKSEVVTAANALIDAVIKSVPRVPRATPAKPAARVATRGKSKPPAEPPAAEEDELTLVDDDLEAFFHG